MGWTSYYREPGQSDVDHLRSELFSNGCQQELLAGATVHTTFYGACRDKRTGEVWALIVLQHRGRASAYGENYSYKDMTETMGPVESECPRRILELLSPLAECQHEDQWCKWCGSQIVEGLGGVWIVEPREGMREECAGRHCYSGYRSDAPRDPIAGRPFHEPGGTPSCSTCWAREWRQRCWSNIHKRELAPRLTKGDTITFARAMTFSDDVKEDTFTLVNGKRNWWSRAGDRHTVRLPARSRWPEWQKV